VTYLLVIVMSGYIAATMATIETRPYETLNIGFRGDPQLNGFQGQNYQVHGISGSIYSLISDRLIAVNARFQFLKSGHCPIFNNTKATNCFTHPGNYFSAISIMTSEGDILLVESGSAIEGFQSITFSSCFDSQVLKVQPGDQFQGALVPTENGKQKSDRLFFRRLSSHVLEVIVGLFSFKLENSDHFINLAHIKVTDWERLTEDVKSHGLIGQSWNPSRGNSDAIEGEVDDYVIYDNELTGTQFQYSQFEKPQHCK